MKLVPDIVWRAGGASGAPLDARLLPLLREIHARATLRAATAALGMSYRSAWNLLGAQARRLGAPLVVMQRGRGARLAPLAERLLAADGSARNALQAAQLSVTAESRPQVVPLRVAASHDLLLAELAADPQLALDVSFKGSLESLGAYARGEAEVAGFHVQAAEGADPLAAYRGLLSRRRDQLIGFAVREQGLIVARGNPKRLHGAADLARRGVRFVNRQRGSGTRLLIDQLLREAAIDPASVRGYADEEFTHVAVAATIAAKRADAGVGVRAAAARFGLDFVPLEREHYWLAVPRRLLRDARVARLLAALRGDSLRRMARKLTGYDTAGAGELHALDALAAKGGEFRG
jgi:putative molybdopterin biosynthesis protein